MHRGHVEEKAAVVSKVTVHSFDRRHEPPTIFSKSCAKHNKAAVGQGSARKSSGAGRQGVLPNGMAAGPIWPRQARWRGRETDRQGAAPRCSSAVLAGGRSPQLSSLHGSAPSVKSSPRDCSFVRKSSCTLR